MKMSFYQQKVMKIMNNNRKMTMKVNNFFNKNKQMLKNNNQ